MSAIEQGLRHGSEADGAAVVYDILQDLERYIPEVNRTGQARLNVWDIDTHPVCLFFREPLIRAGMAGYVRQILRTEPDYFSGFEKPVLRYVISDIYSTGCSKASTKHVEMLRCLLDSGLDPNARYYHPSVGSTTPWRQFIWPHSGLKVDQALYNSMLSLMIKHGADPDIAPQWAISILPECTKFIKEPLGSRDLTRRLTKWRS